MFEEGTFSDAMKLAEELASLLICLEEPEQSAILRHLHEQWEREAREWQQELARLEKEGPEALEEALGIY